MFDFFFTHYISFSFSELATTQLQNVFFFLNIGEMHTSEAPSALFTIQKVNSFFIFFQLFSSSHFPVSAHFNRPWNEIKIIWTRVMDDHCIKYEKPVWVTWLRKRIFLWGMLPQVLGVGVIPCLFTHWLWKAGTKTTFKITDRREAVWGGWGGADREGWRVEQQRGPF